MALCFKSSGPVNVSVTSIARAVVCSNISHLNQIDFLVNYFPNGNKTGFAFPNVAMVKGLIQFSVIWPVSTDRPGLFNLCQKIKKPGLDVHR